VPENQGPAVGIDVGLQSFLVGSDGRRIDAPKFLARSQRKLARLQRQLARKQKGSVNRAKAKAKLAKVHFKVACQRADFLHKASHYYAKNFGTVCIETLNVAGMVKNHCLARAISDAGWSEFARQLRFKTQLLGSHLVEADRWFPSSKTCSECGVVLAALPLSVRKWTCECGAVHDRDENAATNLENYGRLAVTSRIGEQSPTPVESHGAQRNRNRFVEVSI
jgi:putative transposase